MLCDVYEGLGQVRVSELLGQISIGRLRTYQMFDRIKTRLRLNKLNQENLKKIAPKGWARILEGDEVLALELAQSILVSHLEMIIEILNFLGVPHQEGFFEKDAEIAAHLTDGWQQRVLDNFRAKHPETLLLFYVNHLAREVSSESQVFVPAGA